MYPPFEGIYRFGKSMNTTNNNPEPEPSTLNPDNPQWHVAFMRDEPNLARLWAQATTKDDPDGACGFSDERISEQYAFLVRTWPAETDDGKLDIDSLLRYAARVVEYTRNEQDCGTFVRRFADYVPRLCCYVAELQGIVQERDKEIERLREINK